MPPLSIKSIFKQSLTDYQKHFTILTQASLIAIAVQLGFDLLSRSFDQPFLGLSTSFLTWIVQLIIRIGLINLALSVISHQPPNLTQLYSKISLLVPYLLGSIFYSLIIIGGVVLLIIPAVIWAVKYFWFSYLIVDQNLKPNQAIKLSGQLTKGHKKTLFFLLLLVLIINLAALITPYSIGIIFSVPYTTLALTHAYQELSISLSTTS